MADYLEEFPGEEGSMEEMAQALQTSVGPQKAPPSTPSEKQVEGKSRVVASDPGSGLAATFDGQTLMVATVNGGKRTENWRPPTQAEVQHLQQNGQLVKAAGAASAQTALAQQPKSSWKKKALIGAGVVAVGAAAWWGYKVYKEGE